MEKKNEYKTPKMEVVALKQRTTLLDGSPYDLGRNNEVKEFTVPV